MLTKREREKIRQAIERAARLSGSNSPTADVPSARSEVAFRDALRLLTSLDHADEEIERLRELVGKLYKIVNLGSLINCEHKCFTKETQSQLFTLLAEARAVVEQRQAYKNIPRNKPISAGSGKP